MAVDVPFGILPAMKISPATGPSGTIISVSGNGYLPSDLLDIDWYDMNARTQTQLTSLQPLNGGGFSRKITAPANLISGYSYEVVVIDTNTGTILQALFIAQ